MGKNWEKTGNRGKSVFLLPEIPVAAFNGPDKGRLPTGRKGRDSRRHGLRTDGTGLRARAEIGTFRREQGLTITFLRQD